MARWSKKDLAAHLGKGVTTRQARGLEVDRMNKWERAFANEVLALEQRVGQIVAWRFESVKLRIGDRCWYTPDFEATVVGDVRLHYYEVKGFWRDDARVKIKAAAAMYPERLFVAVTGGPGRWQYEFIRT